MLGEPVSLLGAQITLLGLLDEDLDGGVGLDGVHLAQDRALVAFAPVILLVAPIASAISRVGFPVAPVGLSVASIRLPVASIRLPVTPICCQVPLSVGLAIVGRLVALGCRPVARRGGKLSLRRGAVPQVRSPVAAPRSFLAPLGCWLAVVHILEVPVTEGVKLLRPAPGGQLPLVGDMLALVGHPVTLVGNTVALVGQAIALVGAALALLGPSH